MKTKHEERLYYIREMFCGCRAPSLDPKDHKSWCPYIVWKVLKPQPKKDQKPLEKR